MSHAGDRVRPSGSAGAGAAGSFPSCASVGRLGAALLVTLAFSALGCVVETMDNAVAPTAPVGAAPPTTPVEASGCVKEMDCKGDRVCEGGQCVSAR